MNLTQILHFLLFQKSNGQNLKTKVFQEKSLQCKMSRQLKRARKSTGGKAPRKMISHPKLAQWERENHPEWFEDTENDKECQIFPSTSDVQIQNSAEQTTSSTQTPFDLKESMVAAQRRLAKQREIIDYLDDDLVVARQRLHDAEKLYKALLSEKTSICTKDCCKDSL